MAYTEGNVYCVDPTAPLRVICDTCAHAGAVPFTVDKDGTRWQARPWCWYPRYGAPCHRCGKDS
jgi:hypothetical protein